MQQDLFVIDPHPVVAMDLSMTLGDCIPQGVVHIYASLAEALEKRQGSEPALVGVIAAPNDIPARRELKGAVGSLARNLVIVADDLHVCEEISAECVFVQRPFSTKMISDALMTLGVCRQMRPPVPQT